MIETQVTEKLDSVDLQLIRTALNKLMQEYNNSEDDYLLARGELTRDLLIRIDALPTPGWLKYHLAPERR